MDVNTLQGTNISPQNGILKMIFLFPTWDMLIPWRVCHFDFHGSMGLKLQDEGEPHFVLHVPWKETKPGTPAGLRWVRKRHPTKMVFQLRL